MKALLPCLFPLALSAPLAAAEALTPTNDALVNTGQHIYATHCAVCHGAQGRGDGPYRPLLRQSPPDLTQISQRANGVFPFWRVYDTVSGSELLPAHGTREMPIWGEAFAIESANTALDAATYTRGRLFALMGWLMSIQR